MGAREASPHDSPGSRLGWAPQAAGVGGGGRARRARAVGEPVAPSLPPAGRVRGRVRTAHGPPGPVGGLLSAARRQDEPARAPPGRLAWSLSALRSVAHRRGPPRAAGWAARWGALAKAQDVFVARGGGHDNETAPGRARRGPGPAVVAAGMAEACDGVDAQRPRDPRRGAMERTVRRVVELRLQGPRLCWCRQCGGSPAPALLLQGGSVNMGKHGFFTLALLEA